MGGTQIAATIAHHITAYIMLTPPPPPHQRNPTTPSVHHKSPHHHSEHETQPSSLISLSLYPPRLPLPTHLPQHLATRHGNTATSPAAGDTPCCSASETREIERRIGGELLDQVRTRGRFLGTFRYVKKTGAVTWGKILCVESSCMVRTIAY